MNLCSEGNKPNTGMASGASIGIMGVGSENTHSHSAEVPKKTVVRFSRAKDYVALIKPEVLFLVLITTGIGGIMASESLNLPALFQAIIGTALVAGGTAALNHYLEREHDARMRRTAR